MINNQLDININANEKALSIYLADFTYRWGKNFHLFVCIHSLAGWSFEMLNVLYILIWQPKVKRIYHLLYFIILIKVNLWTILNAVIFTQSTIVFWIVFYLFKMLNIKTGQIITCTYILGLFIYLYGIFIWRIKVSVYARRVLSWNLNYEHLINGFSMRLLFWKLFRHYCLCIMYTLVFR